MSSKGNPYPILPDGETALNNKLKDISDAILVEANNQAHKDGHPYLDKTYIEKASKRIKILGSKDTKVWAARIFLLLTVPFIIFQMGCLRAPEVLGFPVGLQISLWILPIFLVVLIGILSWAFWDFIS